MRFFPKTANPMLPHSDCKDGRSESDELKEQATEGLKSILSAQEYKNFNDEDFANYFDRLNYELGIINKMGFLDIFNSI